MYIYIYIQYIIFIMYVFLYYYTISIYYIKLFSLTLMKLIYEVFNCKKCLLKEFLKKYWKYVKFYSIALFIL